MTLTAFTLPVMVSPDNYGPDPSGLARRHGWMARNARSDSYEETVP